MNKNAPLIICAALTAGWAAAGAEQNLEYPAEDVVITAADSCVRKTPDFTAEKSLFAAGGAYLCAKAGAGIAPEGWIRIPTPAGKYYVYLAWIRDPYGAEDATVRLAGSEYIVDQSVTAGGRAPEQFDLSQITNQLKNVKDICGSGLYRLTEKPVELKEGDVLELLRSDTEPQTVTTFDYALFSPHLYLDDMGNDVESVQGKPELYPLPQGKSGGIAGFGHLSLKNSGRDALVWKVNTTGVFLLSALPQRAPAGSRNAPLAVELPDGGSIMCDFDCRGLPQSKRTWQDLAVVNCAGSMEISVWAAEDGSALPDLLRLTPIPDSALIGAKDESLLDTFTIQWEEPSEGKPWLREITVKGLPGETAGVIKPFPEARGMPHGGRVHIAGRRLPAVGLPEGVTLAVPANAWRVELADNYGFTVSKELLQSQPFLLFRNLGVFVAEKGDFAVHKPEVDRRQKELETQLSSEPFRSTSERYYEWSGLLPSQFGNVGKAFDFAYHAERPFLPRISHGFKTMPEPTYEYFCGIIPDRRQRKTFLGWPHVAREFYVRAQGSLGTYFYTGGGTGHTEPEDVGLKFGAGEPPVFRAESDAAVRQYLEDGYQLIVHTEWREGDSDLRCTAFAYPAEGEDVRTGAEVLNAFVRFRRLSGAPGPLWLEVLPQGPYHDKVSKPLTGLLDARIAGNILAAKDSRILLGFTHAEAEITEKEDSRLVVKFTPKNDLVDIVFPYTAISEQLMRNALELGFEQAMERVKNYWNKILAAGATFEAPDPIVANMYKTLWPRTLCSSDLDTDGLYVLKTAIHYYEGVWLHGVAYGAEGAARRGYFDEAKKWLDTAFAWQSPELREWAKNYTTNEGFFGGPPRYTPIQWVNFHGWIQWAAARYVLFSDDRQWLEAKLPALLKSMEWTMAQRRLTMKENPDGSRPINYGWLPAGRVTDGTSGTSTFSDCINWMGFNELVRVLERIGHERARESRTEADDYRACILRGLRLAARQREPVRLNDGTFVPYVPGTLESLEHEENLWYAGVVDGPLEGILDSGILAPADPMQEWVLANLEDNLFVLAPNLADEAYFLGHLCAYLQSDMPEAAIYTFYSVLANHMSRQTLTTFEHRSWGDGGAAYELVCWPLGYFTRVLAGMLCYDEPDELFYCRAIPRVWLDAGKTIKVERLQTRYGPTDITLRAEQNRITGEIRLPSRHKFSAARLRLRVNGKIREIRLNGMAAAIDEKTNSVLLPGGSDVVKVEADVAR